MRALTFAPLVLALGCTPSDTDGDTDTDATDSAQDSADDTSDDTSDDTGDDSDTAETDDTDPVACAPTTPPSGLTSAPNEPAVGEDITFTRTIEACASSTGITGQWWVEVLDGDGDLVCRYVSTFTADAALSNDACTSCAQSFGGVSFTTPVRTNSGNCDLFGQASTVPAYFSTMRREYTALGTTTNDLLHNHVVDGWIQVDASMTDSDATVTRTGVDVADGRKITVRYTTTYDY